MSGEVRKAIDEANASFGKCVRAGDAAAIAACYTEDACLLPPNSGMIHSRKGVQEFWGGAISRFGLKDVIFTTMELFGAGDTITEVGEYLLKIQPQGQKQMEDKGKYIVVWKNTPQGWKLHRDIWNTSLSQQQ